MSIDREHPDYLDLRSRIRENPKEFVAVVGAGLSRPCGLPGWSELRDILIDHARGRTSEIPLAERSGREAALDRLAEERDLWSAFTELEHLLPPQAYEHTIRDCLTLKDKCTVLPAYELLWKLGIKGVVTFNIDTCAHDSFARVQGWGAESATARDTARFPQFLSGNSQFVFQPHGLVSDRSTWVFTHRERNELLGTKSYTDFMKALCQGKQLLILGFNPQDFAFEYLIQNALTTPSSTGSRHYVLLASVDHRRQTALEEKGFAVIPYRTTDQEAHPEIEESLRDFLAFVPQDDLVPSVYTGSLADPASLPSDDELIQLPLDEVREALNGAVAAIIPPGKAPTELDAQRLEEFYASHLRAIHMAWLIQPNSECDLVHGYKVLNQKGRGAFGQVYEARDVDSGERVAVKVLLPEVRHEREYLNSFRRGVRSMRILTEHHVQRMVQLIDAFEVPACILMDFVDGPTLTEAVTWGLADDLSYCLEILCQVGEVVHEAHDLEERVLHRDLKPDNVILRDGHDKNDRPDVVVVDFDLSWHKGASDLSVVHGARAQGYAAPEQTATGGRRGVSTRHTAVDAFGFGMLGFFVFVGVDPRPNEQNFSCFEEKVRDAIRTRLPSKWRSLPAYLAHVVVECTRDDQESRLPFTSALTAFRNAKTMAISDSVSATDPLVLEELAAMLSPETVPLRTDFGRHLSVVGPEASKRVVLSLKGDGDQISIELEIQKSQSASDPRGVAKYLERAKDRAVSKLNKHNFCRVRGHVGQGNIVVSGTWLLDRDVQRSEIEQIAGLILESRAAMDFGHDARGL